MPPKSTAHAELDLLEQRLADAVVADREAEAKRIAAEVAVEDARDRVREAHDLNANPAKPTAQLEQAKWDAEQAALAKEGIGQRVARAERDVDRFKEENGLRLLEERAPRARELAGEVTRLAHELVRASKAMDPERAHSDRLIAAVSGLSPMHDGPPSEHEWAPAVRELRRAVSRTPELEPLLPRLGGLRHRASEESAKRRLRRERGQETVEVVDA